jgi:transmembrane sensor
MPDYSNYAFEDFVQDERFRRWVLMDPPTDRDFWNQWINAHPEKLDLVLAARQFVSQMKQAQEELSDEELESEVSRIRLNRQRSLETEDEMPPNPFGHWWRIAAVIVLVGIGVWLFFFSHTNDTPLVAYQQRVEQQTGTIQEVQNIKSTRELIRLPDGSEVTLSEGSKLSFPTKFTGSQREVFLIGEAFFDVVRKPEQPFVVYTNALTTRVLGTSFTVRAYDSDQEAKVVVKSGKVSVYRAMKTSTPDPAEASEPSFILSPNQQVTFSQQDRQMKRTLVDAPEPVDPAAAQAQRVAFDHTPVVEVFKKLEQIYGITINYDAGILSGCELTAEFSTESLYERLDLISRATESRYDVVDAQIVIYSKGCQSL